MGLSAEVMARSGPVIASVCGKGACGTTAHRLWPLRLVGVVFRSSGAGWLCARGTVSRMAVDDGMLDGLGARWMAIVPAVRSFEIRGSAGSRPSLGQSRACASGGAVLCETAALPSGSLGRAHGVWAARGEERGRPRAAHSAGVRVASRARGGSARISKP